MTFLSSIFRTRLVTKRSPVLFTLIMFALSIGVAAQLVTLDLAFDPAITSHSSNIAIGFTEQSDGKYYAYGYQPFGVIGGATKSKLVRFNADGTFDGGQFSQLIFGQNGDKPLIGDYDGDGKTDLAVYRSSNGGWYILNSGTGTATIQQFGLSEDKPVAADYDGDGKADIAVFRPSNGGWYLLRSTAGFTGVQWGTTGDIALPNAFVPQ